MAEKEFSFFDIDVNRLDEEFVRHPRVYHEHASRVAELRAAHERAKADKELVVAELDREVRLEPARFALTERLTEALVERTVTLQPRYRQAVAKMLQAKHELDVAQLGVDTLDHKKRCLEKLADLLLADYYAVPRARPAANRKLEEARAEGCFGRRAGAEQ